MRNILVTWGTKLGGTESIARIIGEVLQQEGYEVTLAPAARVRDASGFAAAIVGGALYANRWHRDARRFIARNVGALRRIPVWLFSSGPLDDSSEQRAIPPVTQVAVAMERIGARGHMTFGGRLAADAKGVAGAMAKTHAGDWRNPTRIRAWAERIARELPDARPGLAIDHPAHSVGRLIAHGVGAWAACAAVVLGLVAVASPGVARAAHAMLAPVLLAAIAVRYFRGRGARDPLSAALTLTAIVAGLDAVLATLVRPSAAVFGGFVGSVLPLALGFAAVWLAGLVMSTLPWPKLPPKKKPVAA